MFSLMKHFFFVGTWSSFKKQTCLIKTEKFYLTHSLQIYFKMCNVGFILR